MNGQFQMAIELKVPNVTSCTPSAIGSRKELKSFIGFSETSPLLVNTEATASTIGMQLETE